MHEYVVDSRGSGEQGGVDSGDAVCCRVFDAFFFGGFCDDVSTTSVALSTSATFVGFCVDDDATFAGCATNVALTVGLSRVTTGAADVEFAVELVNITGTGTVL